MNERIVFFDGICAMCNGFVLFVLNNDKNLRINFISLQSCIAKKILLEYQIEVGSQNLSTIYYLRDGKMFNRSNAILKILYDLKYPYTFLYTFKLIPRFFRDHIYNYIAKNRYSFFKDNNSCQLLSQKQKERIIE